MKTGKTTYPLFNTINSNPLNETIRQSVKCSSLPLVLAVVISISFGFVSNPVKAENAGSEKPHRGYKYIEPKGLAAKPGSVSQGTSESPAATDTDAKKTNSGEQAKTPHENNGAATTDLSTKDVSTEKTTGGG